LEGHRDAVSAVLALPHLPGWASGDETGVGSLPAHQGALHRASCLPRGALGLIDALPVDAQRWSADAEHPADCPQPWHRCGTRCRPPNLVPGLRFQTQCLGVVAQLAATSSGHLLATASRDKSILLWSLPALTMTTTLAGPHTTAVTAVAFVAQGAAGRGLPRVQAPPLPFHGRACRPKGGVWEPRWRFGMLGSGRRPAALVPRAQPQRGISVLLARRCHPQAHRQNLLHLR
jgi:hypothetical protein